MAKHMQDLLSPLITICHDVFEERLLPEEIVVRLVLSCPAT